MKKYLNFFLLAFFALIVSAIRIVQLQFFTDFNIACNNFKSYRILSFNVNLKSLSCFMYVVVVLYCLILFFLNFKKKKEDSFVKFYEIENKAGSKVRFFLVLFFILTFLFSILYLHDLKYLKLQGYKVVGITFISQIFLSLYYLYFFYCLQFNKFSKQNFLNLIFLLPIFLGIIRIFGVMFLNYFSFLTVREVLFNNVNVAVFSMFLLYSGKVLVGLNSKKNDRNLIFSGFLSIFFGLTSVIPKIVVYFINLGNVEIINSRTYNYNINILRATNFVFVDLIIVMFTFIFLVKYLFNWSSK